MAKAKTSKKSGKKNGGTSSGGKALVIVESAAKAKTIKKFLGTGYDIRACLGHVRDLASRGRGKERFGIDFEHGYAPRYAPIEGREKTLRELKKASASAPAVYLAPDPDREGEAIAWHLSEALNLPTEKTHRITFNAITKREVTKAIESPRTIDMNLVNAQQARRVLDRLVGFSLSPLLWKKVTKGLSAGRVQSVSVKMVVEREKEINAFEAEEYWRLTALVGEAGAKAKSARFSALLVAWEGRKLWQGDKKAKDKSGLRTAADAEAVVAALQDAAFQVSDLVERENSRRASPPFITSTLQQAASTFLGFGTAKTMRVAQQLYEGVEVDGTPTGLITYMRTDSVRLAPEAIDEARAYIGEHYAPTYLPEKPNAYSSKKGAQDAHEAIRPTQATRTPGALQDQLTPDQYKLYDLIWRRFIASQMTPARYLNTTATITAGAGQFEAKGRKTLFDGHTVLGAAAASRRKKIEKADAEAVGEVAEDDQDLPDIQVGDALDCHELTPTQHATKPPPRYSEASLVRALEGEGIGRPSTYAPIVQTIQDRGYVRLERRYFHATELGMGVTELLESGFPGIMEYSFTAGMEADLDRVEEGEIDWVGMVDSFYRPFEARLAEAETSLEPLKGKPAPNGETCPECESAMEVRYSRNGAFLSCTRFPDCRGARPLDNREVEGADEDEPKIECPTCGAPMVRKRSRFGQFLSCANYPECKQTMPLDRDGKVRELPKIEGVTCEKCGKPMIVKSGRRGPFLACTGYPECKYTMPISKDGKPVRLPNITGTCEKCGGEMVVRSSRRGPFLGCTAYPKCRNAKPIPKGAAEGDHIDFRAAAEGEPPPAADSGGDA